MKKRFCVFIFSLLLVTAAMPFIQGQVQAQTFAPYAGRDCTTNTTAASIIDYAMSKYKDYSTFPGSGECWGFAETLNGLLAAENETKYYKGLKNTRNNFLKKCVGVKAGAHVRFGNSKEFNSWYGHSVVLLSVTEELIFWADNNYDRANTVRYYSGSLDDFFWMYGQYGYLTMVKQPAKYRTYAQPKVSSSALLEEGGIRLTWLRTTKTNRYDVYRSYKKNGTYQRIAKTTSRTFTDRSVEMGKKAYYKIKAVKSTGSKYSSVVANTLRLATPVVTLERNGEAGTVTLSWHAVARADRYKIYRKIGEEKEKLVKTTTGLSYTGKLTDTEHTYRYRVKAVYDRNAEGNSKYSQAFYLYADLPLPTGLSGVLHDDENGSVTLSWNPVKGADCYDLYCCRSADGTYWLEATIEGKTTYFDSLRKPGQQYYYKIAARNSVTGARSQISSWYLI